MEIDGLFDLIWIIIYGSNPVFAPDSEHYHNCVEWNER